MAVREGEDAALGWFCQFRAAIASPCCRRPVPTFWKDKALSSAKMHMENYQRTGDKCGEVQSLLLLACGRCSGSDVLDSRAFHSLFSHVRFDPFMSALPFVVLVDLACCFLELNPKKHPKLLIEATMKLALANVYLEANRLQDCY